MCVCVFIDLKFAFISFEDLFLYLMNVVFTKIDLELNEKIWLLFFSLFRGIQLISIEVASD